MTPSAKAHWARVREEEKKAHILVKRELRELRFNLRNITKTVGAAIVALDAEMKKPSNEARGKRIATIVCVLEFANDSAIRYGLKRGGRRG